VKRIIRSRRIPWKRESTSLTRRDVSTSFVSLPSLNMTVHLHSERKLFQRDVILSEVQRSRSISSNVEQSSSITSRCFDFIRYTHYAQHNGSSSFLYVRTSKKSKCIQNSVTSVASTVRLSASNFELSAHITYQQKTLIYQPMCIN